MLGRPEQAAGRSFADPIVSDRPAAEKPGQSPPQRSPRRWPRIVLIGSIYAIIIIAGTLVGDLLVARMNVDLAPGTEAMLHRIIMASLVAYVLLMAVPFVPSVEIGLALIFMIGVDIVPVVYGSTVLALVIAFGVGRRVPEPLLARVFAALGLRRAAALIQRSQPLSREARLADLTAHLPGRLAPWLLRHRHLAIAAVLNVPGNNLIGGGGGIALAAGMTRLVSFPAFVATVAIGTLPLPILFLTMDALR
jgi:hypothetical protein